MQAEPSISVIIPVFNGELFLADAIDSVLAQTLPANEILVIDDGSTDATAEIAGKYAGRINLHHAPHRGVSAARNRGLDLARWDWIAFLDADDLWLPDKLRLQANLLNRDESALYVTASAELFLQDGCAWPRNYKPEWLGQKQFGLLSSFLGRKKVFEVVGGFDPGLVCSEDMDWFARAKDLHVLAPSLDDILVRKRVHLSNMTVTMDPAVTAAAVLRNIRKTVERQRGKTQTPHPA